MPKKTDIKSRRKNKPKRRQVNERRKDMLIISSASQSDIYIWAISIAIMVAILTTMIILSNF